MDLVGNIYPRQSCCLRMCEWCWQFFLAEETITGTNRRNNFSYTGILNDEILLVLKTSKRAWLNTQEQCKNR
jgi:hypothetical protein